MKRQAYYRTKCLKAAGGRLGVCSLFSVGLSWTLGTFHSWTLWLIITICVVAGSHPSAGPASEWPGQPEGRTSCCQLLRAPGVFLRNEQTHPLTVSRPLGEWFAFLPASSHDAIGCPGPTHGPFSSMPVTCPHFKRAQPAPSLEAAHDQHVLLVLAQMQRCVMEKRGLLLF